MFKNFLPMLYPSTETLQIMGMARHVVLPRSFEILVWNIYKARRKPWEGDFQHLAQGKDMILLQEAVLNTRYDPLFTTSEQMEWVMARSHSSGAAQTVTGVKTGCVAKSSTQSFFLSPVVEPLLKTPKMLLATTYSIEGSGEPLLVVNIHAINFVSHKKFSLQMEQMITAIEGHKGPVLLAGDFNTWNNMRYDSLMDITENMGLKQMDLERSKKIYYLKHHLDHVFYRDLKPEYATVHLNIRSSDHYPISVRFTL